MKLAKVVVTLVEVKWDKDVVEDHLEVVGLKAEVAMEGMVEMHLIITLSHTSLIATVSQMTRGWQPHMRVNVLNATLRLCIWERFDI